MPKLKPKSKLKAKPKAKAMVKPKLTGKAKTVAPKAPIAPARKTVMDSAQQIWLAGVGAFAKAQHEGSKWFEALAKEGAKLEQGARKAVTGKTAEIQRSLHNGIGQLNANLQKTEQIFEEQLARALSKLGIPGRKELSDLLARVDELSREVKSLKSRPEPRSHVFSNTVRRSRDDLSDIAKELEEAQLAARKASKQSMGNLKKAGKISIG